MNGLHDEFSDQIDFFVLNVDEPDARALFDTYAIRNRSTYILLDPDGNEVTRWNGPLRSANLAEELARYLNTLD